MHPVAVRRDRDDRASGSFLHVRHQAIARELAQREGASEVRVNARQNIVAADATTAECLWALLATTSICGMDVRARLPTIKTRSSGFV